MIPSLLLLQLWFFAVHLYCIERFDRLAVGLPSSILLPSTTGFSSDLTAEVMHRRAHHLIASQSFPNCCRPRGLLVSQSLGAPDFCSICPCRPSPTRTVVPEDWMRALISHRTFVRRSYMLSHTRQTEQKHTPIGINMISLSACTKLLLLQWHCQSHTLPI